MGRKRTKNRHLPNRVYIRGASYYYARHDGKWIRLCKIAEGESAMYRALAEIKEQTLAEPTMRRVFERYRSDVLPNKAPSTAKIQGRQLEALERAFGDMDADSVLPHFVAEFHDLRGRKAPVGANRELALLSHVMRLAIRMGLVPSGVNPCSSIERHKEKPRERYIEHDEYNAVWQRASPSLRVLMDLAYLTGQRQADLIKLRRQDLLDDGIYFKQKKTGRAVIVEWTPALRKTIRRALTHGDTIAFDVVIRTRRNQQFSSSGFQTAWKRLMTKLPEAHRFKFRDIRAKARSDGDDKRLLGHANPEAMARIYQRKPVSVRPVR